MPMRGSRAQNKIRRDSMENKKAGNDGIKQCFFWTIFEEYWKVMIFIFKKKKMQKSRLQMSLAKKEFRNPNTNILQNTNTHAQINFPGRTKVVIVIVVHVNQWIIRSDGSSIFNIDCNCCDLKMIEKLNSSTCNIICWKHCWWAIRARSVVDFSNGVRLVIGCSGFLAGFISTQNSRMEIWIRAAIGLGSATRHNVILSFQLLSIGSTG